MNTEDQIPKPAITEKIRKVASAGYTIIGTVLNAPEMAIIGTIVDLMGTSGNRRLEEWLELLAVRLSYLEERLEELFNDDSFVTTVYAATQAAVRTHQEEKREALCNAVLNAASNSPLDDDIQAFYIQIIDQLTPKHITLLTLFNNPERWFKVKGLPWENRRKKPLLRHIFRDAFDDFNKERQTYFVFLRDLEQRGLIQNRNGDTIGINMLDSGDLDSLAMTPLGARFIQYISKPEDVLNK